MSLVLALKRLQNQTFNNLCIHAFFIRSIMMTMQNPKFGVSVEICLKEFVLHQYECVKYRMTIYLSRLQFNQKFCKNWNIVKYFSNLLQ